MQNIPALDYDRKTIVSSKFSVIMPLHKSITSHKKFTILWMLKIQCQNPGI